jgi:hypothetical protein
MLLEIFRERCQERMRQTVLGTPGATASFGPTFFK